jgi:hypothetical protein
MYSGGLEYSGYQKRQLGITETYVVETCLLGSISINSGTLAVFELSIRIWRCYKLRDGGGGRTPQ